MANGVTTPSHPRSVDETENAFVQVMPTEGHAKDIVNIINQENSDITWIIGQVCLVIDFLFDTKFDETSLVFKIRVFCCSFVFIPVWLN